MYIYPLIISPYGMQKENKDNVFNALSPSTTDIKILRSKKQILDVISLKLLFSHIETTKQQEIVQSWAGMQLEVFLLQSNPNVADELRKKLGYTAYIPENDHDTFRTLRALFLLFPEIFLNERI